MAKLKLGSKLLRGAQKVGRGTAKVGKIFGRAKSRVGGAVKSALPGGSAKGKVSKVRGKMSLVPQALQPPEKMTPQARIRNVGRLVENKVQTLVPKLSKAVQRNVNAFDPQAFLGKIFDGGLNSLQNFASGLGGLQTSLQKSMGFINEAKGIIVDLIEKMAKAKPTRSKGGIIKGLLKGAAIVGLAALTVKAAPKVMGAAGKVGGALFKATPLGAGIALAKKVFGRKKKSEEALSKVKGEELKEKFKESLEQFDETLSRISMGLKAKRYKDSDLNQPEADDDTNKDGEETNEEGTSTTEGTGTTEETGLKPDGDSDKSTEDDSIDKQTTTKTADENVDSAGNEIPIGTVVGGDDMQPLPTETKAEPQSDPVNKPTAKGGPDLVLQPKILEIQSSKGAQGDKGTRGALGSQGEPGRDGSSVEPQEGTQEPPKPEGFMRSMAGLGDFLSFGLTDFDKRGDLFKDDKTKVGVDTTSSDAVPQNIESNPALLEIRSQITEGISQPARAAAMEASQTPRPAIAVPVGGKQQQQNNNVMSRMKGEVPVMVAVDPSNIHLTTSKSLFNIVDAL